MSRYRGGSEARSDDRQEVRLADLIIALSLASDLGMGQPIGWGLRACLLAMHFSEGLELSEHERRDLYDLSLLHYLGCTTDAHLFAHLFGNDQQVMRQFAFSHMGGYQETLGVTLPLPAPSSPTTPDTFRESARARCEVAMHLAAWCNFGRGVQKGLWQLFERWDGSGVPNGLVGEQIALPVRVVQMAQDAATTRTWRRALPTPPVNSSRRLRSLRSIERCRGQSRACREG